jgi:hypothetical protein
MKLQALTVIQLLKTLVAVLTFLTPSAAKAALIITAKEVGTDVVFSASGTVNLTGLSFSRAEPSFAGILPDHRPFPPALVIGGVGTGSTILGTTAYEGLIDFPEIIGTGIAFHRFDSTTGDRFGFANNNNLPEIFLPLGYVSGTLLAGTSIASDETFTTLGISPGTFTWNWGADTNADTAIFEVIPEPFTSLLLLVAGVAFYILRRRTKSVPTRTATHARHGSFSHSKRFPKSRQLIRVA